MEDKNIMIIKGGEGCGMSTYSFNIAGYINYLLEQNTKR